MLTMLETTCYLTLEPDYSKRTGKLVGVKVKKVTQSRPRASEDPGARTVLLKVRVPESAFRAYRAELEIPEEDREALVEIEYESPESEEYPE